MSAGLTSRPNGTPPFLALVPGLVTGIVGLFIRTFLLIIWSEKIRGIVIHFWIMVRFAFKSIGINTILLQLSGLASLGLPIILLILLFRVRTLTVLYRSMICI